MNAILNNWNNNKKRVSSNDSIFDVIEEEKSKDKDDQIIEE